MYKVLLSLLLLTAPLIATNPDTLASQLQNKINHFLHLTSPTAHAVVDNLLLDENDHCTALRIRVTYSSDPNQTTELGWSYTEFPTGRHYPIELWNTTTYTQAIAFQQFADLLQAPLNDPALVKHSLEQLADGQEVEITIWHTAADGTPLQIAFILKPEDFDPALFLFRIDQHTIHAFSGLSLEALDHPGTVLDDFITYVLDLDTAYEFNLMTLQAIAMLPSLP